MSIAMPPQKAPVLGLPVHLSDDYLSWVSSCLLRGEGMHVVTLNAEMTMQAQQNPDLASVINCADLVIPDGSGITFYFWLYGKQVNRCPGIELAEALLKASVQADRPWSVFFYGGKPDVAEKAAQHWRSMLPGIKIVGVEHGYLDTNDRDRLQATLKTLQPQIILVGLGVPRQEFWIAENRHLCPNSIWIGVGGSFDIWAGQKSRAPLWLRNNHLEWIYRLYQEPWRWRRMLALPKFAVRSLIYRLTQRQPTKERV
ncbi:MAG: WecB/TagA/CpsF family glycosyltransferase [Cyanobacteria bacterium]|nr:WecB/TagA/CpsF family glycosyltransferase [Cyanobacteriota bacterium]MDW8202349.1 WecB/TagA/CpsF family glycosyltransferase [Cyanobacteriota bacterium SKYGB_h_bin112]